MDHHWMSKDPSVAYAMHKSTHPVRWEERSDGEEDERTFNPLEPLSEIGDVLADGGLLPGLFQILGLMLKTVFNLVLIPLKSIAAVAGALSD